MDLLLLLLAAVCFGLAAVSRPGREVPGGRMDVRYSMEVVTPHVAWANPYHGGPLRVWMMPDVVGGRDVIELAQRLSLEYDTLTFDKDGYNTWGFGDFYGRRGGPGVDYDIDHQYLVEDLTSETRYDVLVLPSTHLWNELPAAARAAVAQRVRDGAGLVLIAPRCHPEHLDELAELSPLLPVTDEEVVVGPDTWKEARPVRGAAWQVTQPHFITSGVPLEALPTLHMSHLPYRATGTVLIAAEGAPLLAVKRFGRGRVVAVGYDNFCFGPRLAEPWRCDVSYPYWEYTYSLLCRALVWAADREPARRIAGLAAGEGEVVVSLEGEPQLATLTVTFRDERYQVQDVAEAAGTQETVAIPWPARLNAGLVFADVVLGEAEGTLDWGTVTFDVPRPVTITDLRPARDVVAVGERVEGEMTLDAAVPAGVTVEVRCEDNYGRVLDRAVQEAAVMGSRRFRFSLATAHALTRLGRVVCEVRKAERVLDQKSSALFVRTPQVWDDYEIIMDRFLPEPAPGRWPALEERLAAMHVSVMGAISPAMSEHVNFKIQADVVAYGFHPKYYASRWTQSRKAYLETRDKQWLVREPCFFDPEFRRRFREDLTAKVSSFVRFSPVSYYAYEEPSLTAYRGGLDVCWCEHCLGGFRDWLRETYGTLEALNAEWGSGYASWDEAMPLTTEEAQAAGNYVPWADFRTWMEVMWADTYREGRDIIRGLDANAIICLSGNQVGTPYNGYDYARINHYVDQMQLYSSENLDEFNRSFYRGMLCTGCTGYGHSNPYLALQLWGWLFNGNTAGVVIFWEISCLNPDLTFCKSGTELAQHFGELRGDGIARLLSTARRDSCGIAIHYSYPSFHGTWATDGEIIDHEWADLSSEAWGLLNRDRVAWTQVLEGLGYQYDFLAYSQLEEGALAKGEYRVLILPHSVAISEKEAVAIEEFVAAGGTVIADLWPGVMDEHCKWRSGGRLDGLFGIDHGAVAPADFRRTEAGEVVGFTEAEREWCEGHAGIARRQEEEGEAIYLGCSLAPMLPGDGKSHRAHLARFTDLVAKLMGEVNLAPPARIANQFGHPVMTCESAHYRAGTADYFGIVRYPTTPEAQAVEAAYTVPVEEARGALEEDNEMVAISFDEARHVYDIRAHEYLGHTDHIDTKLSYGDAKVYARLPYTVEAVEVTGPATVAPGAEVPFRVTLRLPGAAQAGDHVAAIRIYGPEGERRPHYEFRLPLPKGGGEGTIPLALSDTVGAWRIVARDVATGVEGEWGFGVRG